MHKTIERGDCTMDSHIRPYLMYKTILTMHVTRLFLSMPVLPTLIGLHRTYSTLNTPPPSETGPGWVACDVDGKFDDDSRESDVVM